MGPPREASRESAPTMPALHVASRAGLEERVRYLVEHEGVDVNEVDCWDSTALYWATYAGHKSVVELLLANGARCDPETFVGERCMYGALNDEIRDLLRAHNAADFSVAAKHPFARFLRQLAKKREYHDARFVLDQGLGEVSCCRAVLGARSATLRSRFLGPWAGKSEVTTKRAPRATKAVLEYVATGRMVVDAGDVADARKFAASLGFDLQLEDTPQRAEKSRKDAVVFEDSIQALRESMEPLADALVSLDTHQPNVDDGMRAFAAAHADLELRCADGGVVRAPSAFLRAHSEVVDLALTGRFAESQQDTYHFAMPDLPRHAAAALVRWCVCGSTPPDLGRDPRCAADLLAAAHRLMMPADLVAASSAALAEALNEYTDPAPFLDALPLAYLAQDYGSDKLYDAVVDACAARLDAVFRLPAFRAAVLDSANSIQHRQETDSIPLIDDLRTALTAALNPLDLDDPAPEALSLASAFADIDRFLDGLGLQG